MFVRCLKVTPKDCVTSWGEELLIIVTTGEYPSGEKPKPVAVPDAALASIEIDGVQFVTLEKLIELKLASGMTAPDRLKDLADVQELIKLRGLSNELAERLNPYVREKYLELLNAVKRGKEENVF